LQKGLSRGRRSVVDRGPNGVLDGHRDHKQQQESE
jgi:hypothetical protein